MAVVSDFTALLSVDSAGVDERWNALMARGTNAVITYSFASTRPAHDIDAANSFNAFSAIEQTRFREALNIFETAAGLVFVEVPEATQGMIVAYEAAMSSAGAAYLPSLYFETGGDVQMAVDFFVGDPSQGSLQFEIMLHEIGHAVGLKHPFDGQPTLTGSLDNTANTVMSYTAQASGQPATGLQSLDQGALNAYYGAQVTGVTASWNDALGRVLIQAADGADRAFAATQEDDYVITGTGNDTVQLGSGADVFAGGAGSDTAVFIGAMNNFTITIDNGLITVTPNASPYDSGTDYLVNVEALEFAPYASPSTTLNVAAMADSGSTTTVYRFFNTDTGIHFYTASSAERNAVIQTLPNLRYEQAAFSQASDGELTAYRFFNSGTGGHFYTTSVAERDQVQASLPQLSYEGGAFQLYASQRDGTTALHRFYNTDTGAHFYTASQAEQASVSTLASFNYEGVVGWVLA